tara:strand:+ start:952 stop:2169 length:1218 start_codon:yes stop_codon:yes gene_type:complete
MDLYYIKYKSNISVASIWVAGGSDKDSQHKKGINQILSSLLIRGCEGYDNFRLSDYIDSFGADLNCETFEDGILINLKSIELYFHDVYPILKLIIEKPILSVEQFKICKQNIIYHINKSKENPFNIVFENWRKLVFNNHPYAYDSSGYINNINNINYEDILEEYNNFKKRGKVLLSNYYYQNMKNIDSLAPNRSLKKELIFDNNKSKQYKRKCKIHIQNTNQIIILIGNKTCSYENNDFVNLKILESYLAFGMSSKLFRIFRERNGLTYDVGVFNPLRKVSAPFVVYLSSSPSNCLDSFNKLLKLWDQITSKLLSQDELDLAKIKLKSSISASSQTTEELINRKVQLIGLDMDPKLDEKFLKRITKVDAKEILETAQKYLINPSLSVSGKKNYCNQIEKIWQNSY